MVKKLLLGALVSCLAAGMVTGVVSAAWSQSIGWTSAAGTYSPDWGNTALQDYIASDGSERLGTYVRFNFQPEIVQNIKNMYNNPGPNDPRYYYGMDISTSSDTNTSVNAFSIYSTLPGPHYDFDDDPEWYGGNGYNDETETTCTDPNSLLANTDYKMESHWKVLNKTQQTYEFTSQKSFYTLTSGEYNADYYETHVNTQKYPW